MKKIEKQLLEVARALADEDASTAVQADLLKKLRALREEELKQDPTLFEAIKEFLQIDSHSERCTSETTHCDLCGWCEVDDQCLCYTR